MKPFSRSGWFFMLAAGSLCLCPHNTARAVNFSDKLADRPQHDQWHRSQENSQRDQQEESRRAQERAQRDQQEQAQRAQHEQERQAREQQLRAQEEAARSAQQQALNAQREAARQAQQQQRQVQEQQRESQQRAEKEQHDQARRDQEQQRESQQRAERQQRQQARQAQEQQWESQQRAEKQQREQAHQAQEQQWESQQRAEREQRDAAHRAWEQNRFNRAIEPRALTFNQIPLEKALSMPAFDPSLSASEQEHALQIQTNLQTHLFAVQASDAPRDFSAFRSNALSNYINNYPVFINNQHMVINRENTFINTVPAMDYPYWYQPNPNWLFSNGFSLGSGLNVGLDWLRWGWHPYYGPQPEGFLCARDFIPTPWIYVPAYGLWRQPGLTGWAPSGPPYDYTGPITVEVFEPRHVKVRDPYTGFENSRTVNVLYLYNAFFNPEYDRWGYMNRHNYFVWLNL